MLSEYITSLADISFRIVTSMYVRFQYSGRNPMRFAVFWRIFVQFCGFRTPLTPPSQRVLIAQVFETSSSAIMNIQGYRMIIVM